MEMNRFSTENPYPFSLRKIDSLDTFFHHFYKERKLLWLPVWFSVHRAPLKMGSSLKGKKCFLRANSFLFESTSVENGGKIVQSFASLVILSIPHKFYNILWPVALYQLAQFPEAVLFQDSSRMESHRQFLESYSQSIYVSFAVCWIYHLNMFIRWKWTKFQNKIGNICMQLITLLINHS